MLIVLIGHKIMKYVLDIQSEHNYISNVWYNYNYNYMLQPLFVQ
jgi:hypothetical protein